MISSSNCSVTYVLICPVSSPSYDQNYCIHYTHHHFYLPGGCLMSVFAASNLHPVSKNSQQCESLFSAPYQCSHHLHEFHPFRLKASRLLSTDVTNARGFLGISGCQSSLMTGKVESYSGPEQLE